MARVKDMTIGKPAWLLFSFAIPLMLGNVFQQLYTMVDTIIVGNILGVDALAALGAADSLSFLLFGLVIGFTQGFSLLISQRFGAQDYEGLKKTIAISVILSTMIAIVFTVLGLTFAYPILELLNTPENIINMAHTYISCLFAGTLVTAAYNSVAAILRALGDSRTPLYAMIIASIINVILDLLFVGEFHWGVWGAAIATVIAQFIAFIFCFSVFRKIPMIYLKKSHFKPDKVIISKLLKIGTPMALQNAIIGLGTMVVQFVINGFGIIYVAGFTATNKLYGVLELAATSFGYSMATYTGQNLGAKEYRRINKGMNSAIRMSIVTSFIIGFFMIIFGKNILLLFISGNPTEVKDVLDVAYKYLFVMSSLLFILYLLYIYRSALQGMGDTVIPMVSGVSELIARMATILILPKLTGEAGLYFAEVVAWLAADLLLIPTYYYRYNNLKKLEEGEED